MNDVAQRIAGPYGLDGRTVPYSSWRRRLRSTIHFFSHHLILNRHTARVTRASGFRLTVGPTVFHPRYFITSESFASVIGRLDLSGKRVADVGTGSGILALAAARAAAGNVSQLPRTPALAALPIGALAFDYSRATAYRSVGRLDLLPPHAAARPLLRATHLIGHPSAVGSADWRTKGDGHLRFTFSAGL